MRSCREDIRTIENGEKNLFLRRTFNRLFAGAGEKRKRETLTSDSNVETSTSDSNEEIAKKILKKHNNNVQRALMDPDSGIYSLWTSLSVGEKFRLLTQEAAKIASEQKPKKQKKEKETCPVCYVEIDTLSSAEYTMCPTCKRPTCNACLCKRYKTTGYDTDGYVNMTRNRSICPRCNGKIPHLKTLCMPRYQWEAKTKREGKDKLNLDGKKRLTEKLFVEEGDVVQWYPKGSQIPFETAIEVRKRVTHRAVYTKRGRCIPGYSRTGKKMKTGRHKGEYRCRMSNEARLTGFVRVEKTEKYKIKDMLFFVYKVLDEPLKRKVEGRSRKNTRGGTVILLPFCEGHWSYDPNGNRSFGRTRLPYHYEMADFWDIPNDFYNDIEDWPHMRVLADKSELAILTNLRKNKIKLGSYSFGSFIGGEEFDSGINFKKLLRHDVEKFKWHHVGKTSYGDYYLEPISNDDDSDDDNDSDSDDDPIFDDVMSIYTNTDDTDDENNPDDGNDSDVSHASTVIIPGRGGNTIQDIFGESDSDEDFQDIFGSDSEDDFGSDSDED